MAFKTFPLKKKKKKKKKKKTETQRNISQTTMTSL